MRYILIDNLCMSNFIAAVMSTIFFSKKIIMIYIVHVR